jgi:enoyl-CoA hydratase/carnithine racemase
VRLNRPEQLNAISWDLFRALGVVLRDLEADPAVRCVLITGNGRAFSAGGDIKAYAYLQADAKAFTEFVDEYCDVVERITAMTKPVIALVNGICAAGGLELVLGCDFAWAAESARIGDMHINFAQIGGAGALARLPRRIGAARALELVLSGVMLDSATALDWGLVNRVLPDSVLIEEGLAFAASLAAKSPTAAHYLKRAIHAGTDTDLHSALKLERDQTLEYCLGRPDSMEGVQAFIEKRQPNYGALR